MTKLKIAIIIGSTREARFGPIPAQWLTDIAKQRHDMTVELVDLKAFNLPLFNELGSNLWAETKDPAALAWQRKIAGFDGYVVVTPEYNRGLPASMKNAFDQAYVEWNTKPIAFFGYGGIGGAYAVDSGRTVAIELKMVPIQASLHIATGDYIKTVRQQRPISEIEANILPSALVMLDQLAQWGWITKAAREGLIPNLAKAA